MTKLALSIAASIAVCALGAASANGQSAEALADAIQISSRYRIVPNVTYVTANNWDAKLDVYQSRGATTPAPTLIHFHGGNWIGGSKEGSSLTFLPFLAMGWNVVNVEYRVARVSLAPAAVEDCRCALRWVYRNAKEQAVRLHQALDKAKVPNQLITIPKGAHGGFSSEDMTKIYAAIRTFVGMHAGGRSTSNNP